MGAGAESRVKHNAAGRLFLARRLSGGHMPKTIFELRDDWRRRGNVIIMLAAALCFSLVVNVLLYVKIP